jgi:hypothetical protein
VALSVLMTVRRRLLRPGGHLAAPPGLWPMAVMFLNVKRRGGSTARIARAAGASLAIAVGLHEVLPGRGRQSLVSLGTARPPQAAA